MKKTRKATRIPIRKSDRATSDALRILNRVTGRDEKLRALIAEAAINAEIAEMLLAARERAGLTQAQLAHRVGTKQPVIARLEDADYNGHSLTMLQRIAGALGLRIEVRFAPAKSA